jgi:hypothetical protein
MKTLRILSAALGLAVLYQSSRAADIPVLSLNGNGMLTWTNYFTNALFTVQWAPSLAGNRTNTIWSDSWTALKDFWTPTGATTVSVPMFYQLVATQPRTVRFSDYIPRDPNQNGRKTIEWVDLDTNGIPVTTNLLTNAITAFERVPYTSGALFGVKTENGATEEDWVTYMNDGDTVRFLGASGWFASVDTNFTAHPDILKFNEIYDGLYVDLDVILWGTGPGNVGPDSDPMAMLFTIATVTMPSGVYTNAVLGWSIDKDEPYRTLTNQWRLTDLGITMPTSTETHGYLPCNVDVFGKGVGFVGGVEIGGGDDYIDGVWRCLSISD